MKKILTLFACFLSITNFFAQGPPIMWNLNGNAPNSSTQFIGTTNSMDLIFKTNSQERLKIDVTGGFTIRSLIGTGYAVVMADADGKVSRINIPNNYTDVLNGNGSFVSIQSLSGWSSSGGNVSSTALTGTDGALVKTDASGKIGRINFPNSYNTVLGGTGNFVNINDIAGWSSNGSVILSATGKNVGIGTNFPTVQLEVVGKVNIDGHLHVDSIQVGDSSLHIISRSTVPLLDPGSGTIVAGTQNEIYTDRPVGFLTDLFSALYINCRNPSAPTHFNMYMGNVTIGIGSPFYTPTCKFRVRDGNNNNLSIGYDYLNGNNGMIIDSHKDAGKTILNSLTLSASQFYFHGGAVKIGDVSSMPLANVTDGYNLFVKNGILTERVKVAISGTAQWADYVLYPDYKLLALDSVELFAKYNCHLPGMPSADDVVKGGIDVAKMDALLLKQIEEVWLQLFLLKKENEELKLELKELKNSHK